MNGKVEVSVIIPTFNMAEYLPRSLGACLSQTCRNIEVIVIDDGSTDGTADLLQEFSRRDSRVRPYHLSHVGVPSIVRNTGISRANGSYIQFLDADDYISSIKLERQLDLIRKHLPNEVVAYCDYRIRRPDSPHGNRLFREGPLDGNHWPSDLATLFAMYTVLHRFLYPIEVLRRNGAFDESLTHAEDLDLWCRLLVKGVRFVYDSRPMAVYYQHFSHSLRSPQQETESRLRALEKLSDYLDQQGLLEQYRGAIATCFRVESSRKHTKEA